MANITKLILPLATDIIEKKHLDTSDKMGFVDAFIEDKNNPQLRSKLFLMYRTDVPPSVIVYRNYDFENNSRFYQSRLIRIKGVWYSVYIFSIFDKDVIGIYDGIIPTNDEKYLKIHKFWNFEDAFINKLLCNRHLKFDTEGEDTQVPEQDYLEEDSPSLEIQKNPGA